MLYSWYDTLVQSPEVQLLVPEILATRVQPSAPRLHVGRVSVDVGGKNNLAKKSFGNFNGRLITANSR